MPLTFARLVLVLADLAKTRERVQGWRLVDLEDVEKHPMEMW